MDSTFEPHRDDRAVIGSGRLLHLVHGRQTGIHAHHALKICIPLEGELAAADALAARQGARAALLAPPHVQHFAAASGAVLALFIEPEALGPWRAPREEGLRWVDGARFEDTVRFARDAFTQVDSDEALAQFSSGILDRLGLRREAPRWPDRRVARVLQMLDESPRHLVALDALAAAVDLSPSHLSHLFRAEVGIAIRHYGLWRRTFRGLAALARTRNACEAACEAGFADQAHFTRSCQRMFGQPPSVAPRNLRVLG